VRVGVHTGEVLLGGGVAAVGNVRGMAVNVAARMEQTAPLGEMRISHDTYRLIRGVFDVEVQPQIEVKGLAHPLVTYLVRRAKPRAFRIATRGIEGIETRMVGRSAELEHLQDAFRRVCSERNPQNVLVVADAGLGKSRLLYEFANWSETRPEAFYLFQGRANPQTESQPFALLRDILAWRFQIADGDSMQAAKEKLEAALVPLLGADDGDEIARAHAHVLGHLIGLDYADSRYVKGIQEDGKQIRDRGFHAAAQLFRRLASRDGMPIVMQLDDIHWADDGSLSFLSYLGKVNHDVPMLTVGLTRPSLFERRNEPIFADALRIDLTPLDGSSSDMLVDELLRKLPEIPHSLRELITRGAEGNPFYAEELIKMLVDEGAIETSGDSWRIRPDQLESSHVPKTLTGVIQARLDSLLPAEKLALQQASVIGSIFWDRALAAIDPGAPAALRALERRELIVARPEAGFEGVREYAFRHHLLHHVTYGTVLKRNRRRFHGAAAAWLAGLGGARANDFLGTTAEHFSESGDNASACEYFARAAEHATRRFSLEAATLYLEQALAHLEGDELEQRWRLFDLRERVLRMQGKRAEQRNAIDSLQEVADALNDDRRRADVAWRRSTIAGRTGDFRASASEAQSAWALAERAEDVPLSLRAQQRLAIARCVLGDPVAGKALAQGGLTAARAHGLRQVEASFLNALCFIAVALNDVNANLELTQQELSIHRESANLQAEALVLSNLGVAWGLLGARRQARDCLEESLRKMNEVGNRQSMPYSLLGLSQISLHEGDFQAAMDHAQSAYDTAMKMQDARAQVSALCALGNSHLSMGTAAAGDSAFDRAATLAVEKGSVPALDATAGRAVALVALGKAREALRIIEDLLTHLATTGTLQNTDTPALVRLRCYQVLERNDDPRAVGVLAQAHAELQATAATITDETLRGGFLKNIPEHREIAALWNACNPRSGD
jgi:tetratricopeptide (TPR) repeat protein